MGDVRRSIGRHVRDPGLYRREDLGEPEKLHQLGEGELIGGPEKRSIVVVDYDPSWPGRFEAHRATIARALGRVARRIEHVGSTAVPGLAAKPIIDIQLSVDDVEDERTYVPPLEHAGYSLRVREPGHRMLRVFDEIHVHVCSAGGDWERRHLLFRDRLRRDGSDRELYARAKQELARRDWETMNHYADAKADVIATIMDRAEQWARQTGWTP
jgi:GrpB-like predicted nucleotidyltransferase (UPF0157 family)